MPTLTLLEQFARVFPNFCKVGTGYNASIDFGARGFIAVTPSVSKLRGLPFEAIFIDEAHHPLPSLPRHKTLYRFSATHRDEADFQYTMGHAIEDGILCDYDVIVPVATLATHHPFVCLAALLLQRAGQIRRVLAFCNSTYEARRFQMFLSNLGLAAWHFDGKTPGRKRQEVLEMFTGRLQKPVHVLVTARVLQEGIDIPNADTCMFVEPRTSYTSIIQAMGRVLRLDPAKRSALIVLPPQPFPNKKLDLATLDNAAQRTMGFDVSAPFGGVRQSKRSCSAAQRERQTAETCPSLRKPVNVLLTAQVLQEGIDIPNADTCMFVEPGFICKRSPQAITRFLRHQDGKPIASIVLPILSGKRHEMLEASAGRDCKMNTAAHARAKQSNNRSQLSGPLDRFLAVLTQADHRKCGKAAWQNIQIVDFATSKDKLLLQDVEAVYRRQLAHLPMLDLLKICFRELDAFVGHGKQTQQARKISGMKKRGTKGTKYKEMVEEAEKATRAGLEGKPANAAPSDLPAKM